MTEDEWKEHRTMRITWTITQHSRGIEVEVIEALIPHACENIERHRVVFHTGARPDGLGDGLDLNGTWFYDRDEHDTFCSELFADLTGMYPYEVREKYPANVHRSNVVGKHE